MEPTTPHAGAIATKSQAIATNDRTVGLEQIPLELRTEIYDNVVNGPTELYIPRHFVGSALLYLSRQLPSGLKLNQQIQSEATTAYFRRTMLSVEKIIAPCPEMLLADTPPTLLFKSLQYLEFTHPQGGTSQPGFANPTTVYDVTSRCPELRVLKILVTEQMLYTIDASTGIERNKTTEEINASMKFTELLESGKKLQTIELACPSAHRLIAYRGNDSTTQFDDFAIWFRNECVKRRRDIDFVIEVGPTEPHARQNPELVWHRRGDIKIAWYFDFFG